MLDWGINLFVKHSILHDEKNGIRQSNQRDKELQGNRFITMSLSQVRTAHT